MGFEFIGKLRNKKKKSSETEQKNLKRRVYIFEWILSDEEFSKLKNKENLANKNVGCIFDYLK